MKNKKPNLILVTTLLLLTSLATAASQPRVQPEEFNSNQFSNPHAQKKTTGVINFNLNFLLSALEGPQEIEPGGTGWFEASLDVTNTFDSSNAQLIWTVYECGDSDCSNPPQQDYNGDGRVDSCSVEGDVPEEKDDCVDAVSYAATGFGESLLTDETFNAGETISTSIEYDVPSDEEKDLYVAEVYVKDSSEWTLYTDIVNEQFRVVENAGDTNVDPDRDDDGVLNTNDDCPDTFGGGDNGCPVNQPGENDDDGDGVVNSDDECPNTFGTKTNGCPEPNSSDSDGDGVMDSVDNCDKKPGPGSNNGCPVNENPVPVGLLILASGIIVLGGAAYLWFN